MRRITLKLDLKFYGDLYKVKDDSPVDAEEWMCFLAKDNAFAETLPFYRQKCVEHGCDAEQIAAVDLTIERMNAWRAANPKRLKNPDARGEKLGL
jgi:hypothetical protein